MIPKSHITMYRLTRNRKRRRKEVEGNENQSVMESGEIIGGQGIGLCLGDAICLPGRWIPLKI